MLGIYLNLILAAFGCLALGSGVMFYLQERDCGYIRNFTILFASLAFLIGVGYAIMGFTPNLSFACIPRFFGLLGIDSFLYFELAFLFVELRIKLKCRAIILGFFGTYLLFDMIIFGQPTAINYVRYEFYTAYENKLAGSFFFHYIYVFLLIPVMLYFGIRWFKSKKARRDKLFTLEVICANFVILFAAIPDMFHSVFTSKYPTFGYSASFLFVYFSWWFAVKRHIMFTPTVKNVSQEIFYSLDIPIIIFDMEGKTSLFNPCAQLSLKIETNAQSSLRSLFTLTDVETMHFLAKSKKGIDSAIHTIVKATKAECTLVSKIKFDNANDPFCIICTVIPKSEEL
ncbi:hypothetical protein [Treponema zioleckii]|uniref:hypothetical protein n=1 Tax=Treponema zioleckii TaxID=331680 RepID=UPI00168B4D98|nr:hypothetical protein [Treponema zioleckii]